MSGAPDTGKIPGSEVFFKFKAVILFLSGSLGKFKLIPEAEGRRTELEEGESIDSTLEEAKALSSSIEGPID